MNKKNAINLICLVIVPILSGTAIYILSRSNSIYFLEFLNLKNSKIYLVDSLKYNLPDGLWAFSISNLILIIWNWEIKTEIVLWFLVLLFLSAFLEFYYGTFDKIDLIYILMGILLPFIYTLIIKIKSNEQKTFPND